MSTRRLAAILAADVVGYSRLMGADEEGTLERLKMLRRELIDIKIDQHHGRIIKTTGDGLLVEFASVVDAVRCATEVQQAMPERNAGVTTDHRIELRIGINLGDVIADDDDLYGDGVNIAARIEALADAGGVFVSGTVYDQVRDKLPFVFEDKGEQQVKNIARPIRVYRVLFNETASTARNEVLPLPDRPSIAILPFANLSADPEQEYFSDGVADDIITELSRDRALFVIARNSSFTYRGRSIDGRQVGRELGVRYVVVGSVRRSANRVRVTAQLIDATTDSHVWAERYDRKLEDVFSVQDEIAEAVATAIRPAVGDAEQRRALRKPPGNLSAWEAYQRGMWHLTKGSPTENEQGRTLFRHAADLDPGFAAPFVGLALTHVLDVLAHGTRQFITAAKLIEEEARAALLIDPNDPEAHAALGLAFLAIGNLVAGRDCAEQALALNRNSPQGHAVRGASMVWSGCFSEGRDELRISLRLDPRSPLAASVLQTITASFYLEGDYVSTAEVARRGLASYPSFVGPRRWLAAALGQLGRYEEAQLALLELLAVAPDVLSTYLHNRPLYVSPRYQERLLDGLRKAGWQG
jgi:adenylate cyclase